MLLAAGLLVLVAGAVLGWLSWRRLPHPWGRRVAVIVAAPAVLVAGLLALGTLDGKVRCAERELWRRPTQDGSFEAAATSIACAGGVVTYNVVVRELRPDGPGRLRAIWRSLGSPVPLAVDHEPPADFIVHAHDGSPEQRPVPPAPVMLEGKDLAPSRMWSFVRGKAQ